MRVFENEGSWKFELLAAETIGCDEQWYARLPLPFRYARCAAFARTHVYYGHWLGRTLRESSSNATNWETAALSQYGQTIFHQPAKDFTAKSGTAKRSPPHALPLW
ncbi:MAG: hypothetical protein IPN95_19465 [Bacteroidetes bacterium]|nr:hypothetical protein [Bacteroidota bacterium]